MSQGHCGIIFELLTGTENTSLSGGMELTIAVLSIGAEAVLPELFIWLLLLLIVVTIVVTIVAAIIVVTIVVAIIIVVSAIAFIGSGISGPA